jgi:hypothetical protein
VASLEVFVRRLLAAHPRPGESLGALAATLATLSDVDSLERAAIGGARSDRVGHAFAAGYLAATSRLSPGGRACLAATEGGSARPRDMKTTLRSTGGGWSLDGEKSFVTLADLCDAVVVVARTDRPGDARPSLRAVRVPLDRPGITRTPKPPTPFAPEIPHAALRFDAVDVADEEILEGDGYADVLKPFRTIEDLHVAAAMLGHLVTVVRPTSAARALTPPIVERLSLLRALARESPADLGVHLSLGPVFESLRRLAADCLAALDEGEERARLERDVALLGVAEGVRQKRLESAWTSLCEGVDRSRT